MIFIPAILIAIAEAATIGLLTGAVICGMEDKRSLPSDAPKSERTAHKCAEQGALVGGIFGAGGALVGLGGAGAAVDDFALSATNSMDDVARSSIGASYDFAHSARGVRTGALRHAAARIIRDMNAPLRYEGNVSRATFFKSLQVPKIANPKEGFTYVVKVENVASKGLYKIGFSKNPAQRLKQIQYDLNRIIGGRVKFTCIIPTKNMFQLESAMHALFDAQRLRNFAAGTEFFYLNPAQLAAACSF